MGLEGGFLRASSHLHDVPGHTLADLKSLMPGTTWKVENDGAILLGRPSWLL